MKPHLYTTIHLFQKICEVISGIIPTSAGKEYKVLDCPAGAGALTQWLNEEKKVSVEAAEYDVAKWTYQSVKCQFTDLSDKIPFPDNTFDLVVCMEGLKHVPNVQKALSEMRRVAKPKAKIVISIPNDLCMQSRIRYLVDGFSDVDWVHPMEVGHENDKTSIYLGTQLSLPYLWFFIQKQGLKIVSTTHDRIRGYSFLLAVLFYPFTLFFTYKAAKSNPKLFKEMISMTWLAGRRNIIICEK